jgi:hypothetical protein
LQSKIEKMLVVFETQRKNVHAAATQEAMSIFD